MAVVWKFGGDRLTPLTPELVLEADFPPHPSDPPTTLDLSQRVWDTASLTVLFETKLTNVDWSQLECLKFDDIIAGLETSAGLASLEYLANTMSRLAKHSLRNLDFHQNATGIRGIQALAPLLQLEHIQSINASVNGLSTEVMIEFHRLLKPAQLTELRLGENSINEDGAEILGKLLTKCEKLEVFWYDGSRPGPKGTAALLEGLANMDQRFLRELNLHDCSIRTNLLRPVIANAHQLRYLNLNATYVDASQMKDVLDTLSKCPLAFLDLACHDEWVEEDEEWESVSKYFHTAPKTLNDVSLEAWSLEDTGLANIMDGLSSQPIRRLNLSGNGLEDTTIFHGKFPALEVLDLRDNMDLIGLADLATEYPNVTILVDDDQTHELEAAVAAADTTDGEVDGLANQLADAAI